MQWSAVDADFPPDLPTLPAAWYQRPTLDVARDLPGRILVKREGSALLAVRIVEVEAYHQHGDGASHSRNGRTARNDAMFRAGGVLYVYFIYGMHFCMNVVTEDEGVGAAVLLRAAEPLRGVDIMRERRGAAAREHALLHGPARLCQALAITRAHDGLALDGSVLGILDTPPVSEADILRGPRIGIRHSTDLLWRFYLKRTP